MPRKISCETGISRQSVQCTAKLDLHLKTFRCREVLTLSHVDKNKRFAACKRLQSRLMKKKLVRTCFSDEKIFQFRSRRTQNDHQGSSQRLLKGWKHFSKSVMVSLAVSNLGKTSLVFVQPGAKVYSLYYCENVLKQGLLPDIQALSGGDFTLQQDGALAHVHEKLLTFRVLMYPPSLNLKTGLPIAWT